MKAQLCPYIRIVKHLSKIAFTLSFLLAAAFSMKGLREPDLWWQIKTGEWILAHRQVPETDVFSYTHQGVAWINIKWGFEVLAAVITAVLGADCVLLLQIIASTLLLWMLWKTVLLFAEDKAERKTMLFLSCALMFPLLLISIEYRMIGRPEMTSHLMTVIYLFVLLKHRMNASNIIYALVPLQMLWANLHEAFAIGVVLQAVFLVATLIEWKFLSVSTLSFNQIRAALITLLLSIAVIFINPYGYKMLLQPLAIFGQVFENKFTTELLPISSHEYWQKEAWLAVGWLILAVVAVGFAVYKFKGKLRSVLEHLPLGYIVVIIAFVYLATTAFRNIIFLVLLLFPLVAVALSSLLGKVKPLQNITSVVAIVFALVLYISVVSNKYYEWAGSRDRFGLEVRPDYHPVGAADFIIKQGIKGKCFSDYLISSYLLWKIPGFATFIDLRDLDVFPAAFFELFTGAVMIPEKFAELDKQHQFSYVVLYRPQFNQLHQWLSKGNGFKLVFADAVAAVYTRDTSSTSALTAKLFADVPAAQPSIAAKWVNTVFNPLHEKSSVSKAANQSAAASYFLAIGQPILAEHCAQEIINTNQPWIGHELIGQIWYNKTQGSNTDSNQIALQQAGRYFSIALQQQPDYYPALMGLGAVYFQQQFYAQAKTMFERATIVEPANVNAWLSLAACHKSTLQLPESLDEAIRSFEKADRVNPNNPIISFELGVLYFRKNDCTASIKRLKSVKGFEGLNVQEQQVLESCLKQCNGV